MQCSSLVRHQSDPFVFFEVYSAGSGSVTAVDVIQVISGRMYGGGQRVAIDLRNWLRANGQCTAALLVLGNREPLMAAQADLVIQYDGRYNRPWSVLATAWQLRKALDRNGWPKLLHSHGWDADCIVALARLGRSSHHCVHLHVLADWLRIASAKSAIKRWFSRRLLTRPGTQLIAVSRAVADHWRTYLRLPGAFSPTPVLNGIDVARFDSPPDRQARHEVVVFGVAARLAPKKGLEMLLVALSELRRRRDDFECRIAGDGPLGDALRLQVVDSGLLDQVRFVGHIDDMPGFYSGVDIYIQPSETEGLPLGLLEALACGLPAVATDVGGTSEVVRDGVEGYLIQSGDSFALADAMSRLLDRRDVRLEMGRAARKRVCAKFSLQCLGERTLAAYRQFLGY